MNQDALKWAVGGAVVGGALTALVLQTRRGLRAKANGGGLHSGSAADEDNQVVSAEAWEAARAKLLVKEKDLTRHLDQVVRLRRALPWRAVSDYMLTDMEGNNVALSSLCTADKNNTVVVYHMMFPPSTKKACPSCTMYAHALNGHAAYLDQRVKVVLVGKAPVSLMKPFVEEQGFKLDALSSEQAGSFQKDFQAEGDALDGYFGGQWPGLSVFVKGKDGALYLSYHTGMSNKGGARGLDLLNTAHMALDLTPRGRMGIQETIHGPTFSGPWFYPNGGTLDTQHVDRPLASS